MTNNDASLLTGFVVWTAIVFLIGSIVGYLIGVAV